MLWLLSEPDRVPSTVRDQLADRANHLLVSAASALEIATKIRVGKARRTHLPTTFRSQVNRIGATALPIDLDHASLAGSMTWANRDPFDRILVAQAVIEGATLVSVDRAIAGLPTPRILSW